MNKLSLLCLLTVPALAFIACGDDDENTGGSSTGGTESNGGSESTGGTPSGGGAATGGVESGGGGAMATGGVAAGGVAAGGVAAGGVATGGVETAGGNGGTAGSDAGPTFEMLALPTTIIDASGSSDVTFGTDPLALDGHAVIDTWGSGATVTVGTHMSSSAWVITTGSGWAPGLGAAAIMGDLVDDGAGVSEVGPIYLDLANTATVSLKVAVVESTNGDLAALVLKVVGGGGETDFDLLASLGAAGWTTGDTGFYEVSIDVTSRTDLFSEGGQIAILPTGAADNSTVVYVTDYVLSADSLSGSGGAGGGGGAGTAGGAGGGAGTVGGAGGNGGAG